MNFAIVGKFTDTGPAQAVHFETVPYPDYMAFTVSPLLHMGYRFPVVELWDHETSETLARLVGGKVEFWHMNKTDTQRLQNTLDGANARLNLGPGVDFTQYEEEDGGPVLAQADDFRIRFRGDLVPTIINIIDRANTLPEAKDNLFAACDQYAGLEFVK